MQDKVGVDLDNLGHEALSYALRAWQVIAHVAVRDKAVDRVTKQRSRLKVALGAEAVLVRAKTVVVLGGGEELGQEDVVRIAGVDKGACALGVGGAAAHHVGSVGHGRTVRLVRVHARLEAVLNDRPRTCIRRDKHDTHLVALAGERDVALHGLVHVGMLKRVGYGDEVVRVTPTVLKVAKLERAAQVDNGEVERASTRGPGLARGHVDKVGVRRVLVLGAQVQANPVVGHCVRHPGPGHGNWVAVLGDGCRRRDEHAGSRTRVKEWALGQAIQMAATEQRPDVRRVLGVRRDATGNSRKDDQSED